ncbi:MAG: endolytic transglycosylase MltG [Bacteroidales bacterium]|jgi:UPF0755 protein|nr:endolytic transglycosylase MltG [Bacteroidales bacterium]
MAYYHSKYASSNKKRRRPAWARFLLVSLLVLIIASLVAGYYLYQAILSNNVWTPEDEAVSVYIPSGSDFEDVKQILYSQGLILNRTTFEWLARQKKYPELVKPGHFLVSPGMSNDELINMLRLGEQVPVKVVFNNIRLKDQLAQKVSRQIEADSAELMHLLNDSAYLAELGLNAETALTLFIPNTYEFYWNTDAVQFMDRMKRENRIFWEGEREEKAAKLGMSRAEVMILASIVEKETNKNDEKATIAGVYLNRLDRNWLLQADPTLVYASGDFGLTRVLNVHKKIDSPYNTYKYEGLPPGPICIPSIASVDAVLNAEGHDYLFFCAKDDLSGYHVFARSITQHNRNARKYRMAIENR